MDSDEWHDRMRGHAEAIGFVCIKWSWLELVLDASVAHLSGMQIGSTEAQSILVQLDTRGKVEVLRAISYKNRLCDEWFEEISKLLNWIDNDIRPLRNRVVHDVWNPPHHDGKPATRTHGRIKLLKPQSRQPLELTTHETIPVNEADITNIANRINAASNQLLDLMKMTPGWAANTDETTD